MSIFFLSVDLALSLSLSYCLLALLVFSLSLTIDFHAHHVKFENCLKRVVPHGSGDLDVDGDENEAASKHSPGEGTG